eukprot:765252-Hanusia_phi.AAC.8
MATDRPNSSRPCAMPSHEAATTHDVHSMWIDRVRGEGRHPKIRQERQESRERSRQGRERRKSHSHRLHVMGT